LRQRFGEVPGHIAEVFDPDALRAAGDGVAQPLLGRGGAPALYVRLSAPPRQSRPVPRLAARGAELDPRIDEHLRLAVRVKDRNLPVLIQGETGAGKEVFARQVHEASARRGKPFVALNCAAIPENLIESELFGYAAGAFTGASSKGMRGLLQQADGGTLFLDE
ncbi:sigma 54-interacting transcriptional regulator, partial [Azotobacter chroococcum]|nr:sigma 54-interacting transcriptional regulator [Azotobacter chroococcum]